MPETIHFSGAVPFEASEINRIEPNLTTIYGVIQLEFDGEKTSWKWLTLDHGNVSKGISALFVNKSHCIYKYHSLHYAYLDEPKTAKEAEKILSWLRPKLNPSCP